MANALIMSVASGKNLLDTEDGDEARGVQAILPLVLLTRA